MGKFKPMEFELLVHAVQGNSNVQKKALRQIVLDQSTNTDDRASTQSEGLSRTGIFSVSERLMER